MAKSDSVSWRERIAFGIFIIGVTLATAAVVYFAWTVGGWSAERLVANYASGNWFDIAVGAWVYGIMFVFLAFLLAPSSKKDAA